MVEIGGLSFAEQVATFAAAQTIVGVLGSGLSGMLYSPAGVRVLTLAPSRWSDLFFFALMQNRDRAAGGYSRPARSSGQPKACRR